MRRKKTPAKFVSITIIFALAVLFVAKFGGLSILRLYIEMGIGTCQKIPILCMAPKEEIINPEIDKEYIQQLLPYHFPKMAVLLPKGFSVTQEEIKRVYYKKRQRQHNAAAIYLLYEEPGFFINLFPQLRKQGIRDNYGFIRRVMFAKTSDIKNLTDAFFVIMKGIFTPDLSDQSNVIMARFALDKQKGFINYNLAKPDNYFDCNVITREGDFFKIYIKDKGARLTLDKVLAIISTLKCGKVKHSRLPGKLYYFQC